MIFNFTRHVPGFRECRPLLGSYHLVHAPEFLAREIHQEMLGLFRRPSTNAFRRSFEAWSICSQKPTK